LQDLPDMEIAVNTLQLGSHEAIERSQPRGHGR